MEGAGRHAGEGQNQRLGKTYECCDDWVMDGQHVLVYLMSMQCNRRTGTEAARRGSLAAGESAMLHVQRVGQGWQTQTQTQTDNPPRRELSAPARHRVARALLIT